jgi:hypothetical protein
MDAAEKTRVWGDDLKTDPENGMLLGPDDCHYATRTAAFYYGVLKFCGCGNPEEELVFLRKVLEAYDACKTGMEQGEWVAKREDIEACFGGNDDFWRHYVYWLAALDLTEHGGSVFGAWLSDEGRRVLELLRLAEDMDADPLSPERD